MTQQNRNFVIFLYSGKTLQNKCLLALKVPRSNTLTRWPAAHRDVPALCLQPFSSRGDLTVLSGNSKFCLRSGLGPLWFFGVQEECVGTPQSTPGRAQPAHEIPMQLFHDGLEEHLAQTDAKALQKGQWVLRALMVLV